MKIKVWIVLWPGPNCYITLDEDRAKVTYEKALDNFNRDDTNVFLYSKLFEVETEVSIVVITEGGQVQEVIPYINDKEGAEKYAEEHEDPDAEYYEVDIWRSFLGKKWIKR